MIEFIPFRLRKYISATFRGHFPWLYSTVDNPIEVPVQIAAYRLISEKYILKGDSVLDVGTGLGYGMNILAEKATKVSGIDIDRRSVKYAQKWCSTKNIVEVKLYNGRKIPYPDRSFDVTTSIDVIEHVPDYMIFLREMLRVSRRVMIISTPNRRSENTRPDGKPKNHWHLREWSFDEFNSILGWLSREYEWNFLNGKWDGPFETSSELSENTMALTPAIKIV
jgi:2-polyprenyl-3-methyl-5-hydroxy-6-metoxy-1,4-benzoquinol methylase